MLLIFIILILRHDKIAILSSIHYLLLVFWANTGCFSPHTMVVFKYFWTYKPKFISKIELGKGIPSVSYNLRHGGAALIDRL